MAGLLPLVLVVLLGSAPVPVAPVTGAAPVQEATRPETPPQVVQPGEIDWTAGVELDVDVRTTRLDATGDIAIF